MKWRIWGEYINTDKVRTLATSVVAGAVSAGSLLYGTTKWLPALSSFISVTALNKFIWQGLNAIHDINLSNLKELKDEEGFEEEEVGKESTAFILTRLAQGISALGVTAAGYNSISMMIQEYTGNPKLQEPDTLLPVTVATNAASLVGFTLLTALGDRSAKLAQKSQAFKIKRIQKGVEDADKNEEEKQAALGNEPNPPVMSPLEIDEEKLDVVKKVKPKK
jgi:hypothetical protein